MVIATCHCGAVSVTVDTPPAAVTDCNCSICRRYGGLWAYYVPEAVRFAGHPEHTVDYVWGDRSLRTFRCRHCGCVTHWEPVDPAAIHKMGVNARNFDPAVLQAATVRRFDGADTWTFFDDTTPRTHA